MNEEGRFLEPFVQEITSRKYKIHFDEDVESPAYYRLVIETLVDATEDDVIEMYFSSNGGDVDSMISIISAMELCKAPIIGHLMSSCHSAASYIFLNCDFFYVSKFGSMLIHRGTMGYSGTLNNVEDFVDFNRAQINEIMQATYGRFLLADELEKVMKGGDLLLNSSQIEERLELMIAHEQVETEEEAVH
jgi:ATP-dependent protease ClpP protease subunit